MVSRSPDRHTFQRDAYASRCAEEAKEADPDMVAFYDGLIDRHRDKFEDPAMRENNMEYDLLTTDWILSKVRASEAYAQNLYAAMCNNDFQRNDLWPVLKNDTWGASWRGAGGIIADMRQEGDYIDWYCSGIRNSKEFEESDETLTEQQRAWREIQARFVNEGVVTEEIRADLLRLGWIVLDDAGEEFS